MTVDEIRGKVGPALRRRFGVAGENPDHIHFTGEVIGLVEACVVDALMAGVEVTPAPETCPLCGAVWGSAPTETGCSEHVWDRVGGGAR